VKMTIRAMTQEERAFSYTQKNEILETSGCVGHLRGDMGATGNSFFTTWDDHVPGLKTDAFKQEFDKVVNLLRFDERYGGVLKDRETLAAYGRSNPDSAFQGNYTQEYAFRADTEDYSYMIRLNPHKGDYNFYIYAYEREMLDQVLQPEKEKINVLVVEPGKRPYTKMIESGLESLQHEVGGYIQAVYPFEEPVAIEEIRADAGLDIGFTLIGMHLKKVAVPLRLENNRIGEAMVLAARTRPKFVGGSRAVYDEKLL